MNYMLSMVRCQGVDGMNLKIHAWNSERDETPLRGPRALKSKGTNRGANHCSEPSQGGDDTLAAPFRYGAGLALHDR